MAGRADTQRQAFSLWLRTGRSPARGIADALQLKFDPYHDPQDGRFTFASGGTNAGSHGTDPRSNASRRVPSDQTPHIPYLSTLHNEIVHEAVQYSPEPGTRDWSTIDLLKWKSGQESIFDFKKQWVYGYRNAIEAASKRFDLPSELVAGVAYNEVGGDPSFADDLGYSLRSGST